MWIGHFKVRHKNCIYLTNSSRFNVVISMYPLNSYVKGKFRYHTNVNILGGEEEHIKKMIRAIKKDKRCLEFSGQGNVYLSHMKMGLKDYHTTNYYTPKIFLLKPIIHEHGEEDWYFGAWEKKVITEMLRTFKGHFEVKVLAIQQKNFTDIFFPQVMPTMTNKQKEALRLAIKEGYYDYPRRTDLQKLATLAGVSRVTFQEHLRKAQSKILPDILE